MPPTRDGLLHDTDVARLAGFRAAREQLFARDLAAGARHTVARDGTVTLELPRLETAGIVRLAEDIARGQSVARWTLDGAGDDGAWRTLASGTTIGYARLTRITPAAVRRVRLRLGETVGTAGPVSVQLFG